MTTVPVVETVTFKADIFENAEARLRRFWRGRVVVPREFGPVDYELTALCSQRMAVGKVSCRIARTSRASVTQPMLQVPLDGSADFRVGRTRFAVGPGETMLLAPGHEYTAHEGAGSSLFLQIDMAALVGVLPPGRTGESRHWAMRSIPLDASHFCGIDLHAEVDSLLRKTDPASSDDRSAGLADLEGRVVSCLTDSLLDRGGLWNFVPAGTSLAECAGEWIEANVSRPITLECLAERFGVSGRWLQKCFMARWGMTPMDYVICRRLALARTFLTSPGESSVTGVAVRCGFSHLGRFAGQYRTTFGESPSETLARAARRRQLATVAKLSAGRAEDLGRLKRRGSAGNDAQNLMLSERRVSAPVENDGRDH